MSPFLASARTFNNLAFLSTMPNCTRRLADSLLDREQLVGKEKKKTLVEGAHQRETSVIFPERERVSPLENPSLPQSHCIYRRRRL